MSEVVDPPTDSNENSEEKRPQFGNRFLTNKDKVFEHNAWDNVEWDEELLSQAKDKVEKNLASFVSSDRKEELERQAADQWDKFYSIHDNRFFKDRNWLFTEFPELGRESNESKTEAGVEGSSSPPSFPEMSISSKLDVEPATQCSPSYKLTTANGCLFIAAISRKSPSTSSRTTRLTTTKDV